MNTATLSPTSRAPSGKALRLGLWAAQGAAGALFAAAGLAKLTMPLPELAQSIPFTADVPAAFVRAIGLVDLLGGLGLVLPAATRILPRLTVWAALGCMLVQVLAMALHVARGEFGVLPVNVVLLGLTTFVAWGRSVRVPIMPRRL